MSGPKTKKVKIIGKLEMLYFTAELTDHSGLVTSEIKKGFFIENDAITCLKCGSTSHNPNDVKETYCGYCKEFLA